MEMQRFSPMLDTGLAPEGLARLCELGFDDAVVLDLQASGARFAPLPDADRGGEHARELADDTHFGVG